VIILQDGIQMELDVLSQHVQKLEINQDQLVGPLSQMDVGLELIVQL
jgi:hypothetical protein